MGFYPKYVTHAVRGLTRIRTRIYRPLCDACAERLNSRTFGPHPGGKKSVRERNFFPRGELAARVRGLEVQRLTRPQCIVGGEHIRCITVQSERKLW